MKRKRLGEVLLSGDLITVRQLDLALAEQVKQTPRRLIGQLLIHQGAITERGLLEAVPKEILYPHLLESRVLIVEDTAAMRNVLKKIIGKVSKHAETAPNGRVGY